MKWTRVANAEVQGLGNYFSTPIPVQNFIPVVVQAETTQAFYVTLNTSALCYSDENDLQAGDIYASNSDLQIFVGAGVDEYPLADETFGSIGWNGLISYTVLQSDANVEDDDCSTEFTDSGYFSKVIEIKLEEESASQLGYGNMFDVVASKSLIIRTLAYYTAQTSKSSFSVWTKSGTYRGFEENQDDSWEQIVSGAVSGNGHGKSTHIPKEDFTPVRIEAGQSRAFFVVIDSPHMLYSNGTAVGVVSSSNSGIEIR